MKRRVVSAAVVVAAAVGGSVLSAVPASAAPIYCPDNQTAVHNGDGTWYCYNGNNDTGAGWHNGTGDKI